MFTISQQKIRIDSTILNDDHYATPQQLRGASKKTPEAYSEREAIQAKHVALSGA